jgi:cell division protein FtsQ
MPVTVSADRRFLRAHVRPMRRKAAWRLLFRVARAVVPALLVALVAYRAGSALVTASVLRIDSISVRGARRTPRSDVAARLDSLRGQNILRVDLEAARQRLLESRWIADAVLRRRLPSSIDVAVIERRPMAIAKLPGNALYLIDRDGTVIDAFGPKYAEFDLPMVEGLAATGSKIDPARLELARRLFASLAQRPDVARRVSQIDVSDEADAVVLLDTDTALLRLGSDHFVERLESYLEIAPRVHQNVLEVDYVDMRYGSKVFVGGNGTPSATTGRESSAPSASQPGARRRPETGRARPASAR